LFSAAGFEVAEELAEELVGGFFGSGQCWLFSYSVFSFAG